MIFKSVKGPDTRKFENHCSKSKVAHWWDVNQLWPKDMFFKHLNPL